MHHFFSSLVMPAKARYLVRFWVADDEEIYVIAGESMERTVTIQGT